MYDELVTRLREEAECPDNYPEDSNLMREAADAIEILQTLSDEQSRIIAEMGAKYQEAAAAIEELSAVCKKQEIELVELTGEVASKPRWIPCSERLPDYDEDVLVYANGLLRVWDRIKTLDDVDYWEDEYGYWVDFNDVDYWMPLPPSPEPPKEET